MKNWSGFYPETIKSQFIKDLVKMEDVGNIQWIFHKTGNTTDLKSLKENVIKALRKADGSPVEELNTILKDSKMRSKLKDWMEVPANQVNSESFIKWLYIEDNFQTIFKIVD